MQLLLSPTTDRNILGTESLGCNLGCILALSPVGDKSPKLHTVLLLRGARGLRTKNVYFTSADIITSGVR